MEDLTPKIEQAHKLYLDAYNIFNNDEITSAQRAQQKSLIREGNKIMEEINNVIKEVVEQAKAKK